MRLTFPTNKSDGSIKDVDSTILEIKKIYVQQEAKKYQRTKEILAEYPEAEIVEVDSHWKLDELNQNPELIREWTQVKAHTLVLGVKESIASRPNGRSTDFIAPSIANGCTGACSYCYVARRKGYANPITTFVNIDKIIAHLDRKCKALGEKKLNADSVAKVSTKACPSSVEQLEQTDPKLWTFDIGENSDISIDAEISDNVYELIQFFSKMGNAKACFATKFVNPNMLLYEPRKRTRIRFSLMPSNVSRVVDVRTSPIYDRIFAINEFVEAGYEVHINLSPVIIYNGWEDDYADLLTEIDDTLNQAAKDQLAAEVIFLTHNEKLHELNMQWHPKAEEQFLWRHWESEEDKTYNRFGHKVIQQKKLSQNGMVNLRYKNQYKQEGIETLKELMRKYVPYCRVRYAF